jgi:hypothetical protein
MQDPKGLAELLFRNAITGMTIALNSPLGIGIGDIYGVRKGD